MTHHPASASKKVGLFSTPWPLYNRPSIQLGTLKAYLKNQFPLLTIETHHFYLKIAEAIGYEQYQAISEKSWVAETIYAAVLFPERSEKIKKLFRRLTSNNNVIRNIDFDNLTSIVKKVSDDIIGCIDWKQFRLAGFSVCLCQLTSTLYFIRKIKTLCPDLVMIAGGSSFSGLSSPDVFKHFPEINMIIAGEGELPLSRLVSHLSVCPEDEASLSIPGVVTSGSLGPKHLSGFCQLETLNDLPAPDYNDYFHLLDTFSPDKKFFPTIPVEISRGCWWRRKGKKSEYSGCAFCNLNLQWEGYRSKKPSVVADEIDALTRKHRTLSVSIVDNVLPLKQTHDIFSKISDLNKDLSLFCETRATTSRHSLATLKKAGVRSIQIGIEALSTRLLKKLNKGTTAIQNLEVMKHCEELGIMNYANLILYFPGSDDLDVSETLACMEFALPFRPMKPVRFQLGLGSPVIQNAGAFGIKAVYNHPTYSVLFPKKICRSVRFLNQAYRGDRGRQKILWKPVKEKIAAWKKMYDAVHSGSAHTPVLSHRDGRDFLIITHRQVNGGPVTHRLAGTSRQVYLYCRQHRPVENILSHFPGLGQDRLIPFLKMMVDKKLMFEENKKYLSLSISMNPTP